MINRDTVQKQILDISSKYLCLELATGIGKTKIAIDWITQQKANTILVVVPRLVLMSNFKKEILKWKKEALLDKITFTTYISLLKYDLSFFDVIVFDEGHHISDRCVSHIKQYDIKRAIILSATIKPIKKIELQQLFEKIVFYKIDTSTAIENDILPEPKIYLWPLQLDSIHSTETIIKKGNSIRKIRCSFAERFKYLKKYPTCTIITKCTKEEKYKHLSNNITYWKDRYYNYRNEIDKNKWLRASLNRLQWLSTIKNNYIKQLIDCVSNERFIVFCNSIKQAQELNSNCISSKNKKATSLLEDFNAEKINSISCVNMLNEGCNLFNCRIGIWAVINSSFIMQCQKLGRNLRHPHPIIIIPYFENTREEEIINAFISDFDSKLINKINTLKDLQL